MLTSFLILAALATSDISPGMQLELDAIETRKALRSGEIEVTVVSGLDGQSDGFKLSYRWDQSKVRADNAYGHRRIVTDQQAIFRLGESDPHIQILDRNYFVANATEEVFHPGLLGMVAVPFTLLDSYTLDGCMAFSDRSDESVKDVEIQGRDARHISYRRAVGSELQIWIAPSINYAVLRCQASVDGLTQSVESDYQQFEGGIWFPHAVKFQEFRDGDLKYEQSVIVNSAKFNIPINPTTFSLVSLSPKSGDIVRRNGERLLWNGDELIDLPDESEIQKSDISRTPPRSYVRWLLIANAVFLAVFAFFVLWRRKENSTKHP